MAHGLRRWLMVFGVTRYRCGGRAPCALCLDGYVRDRDVVHEKAMIEQQRLRLVAEDRQRRAERLRHRVAQALDSYGGVL